MSCFIVVNVTLYRYEFLGRPRRKLPVHPGSLSTSFWNTYSPSCPNCSIVQESKQLLIVSASSAPFFCGTWFWFCSIRKPDRSHLNNKGDSRVHCSRWSCAGNPLEDRRRRYNLELVSHLHTCRWNISESFLSDGVLWNHSFLGWKGLWRTSLCSSQKGEVCPFAKISVRSML